MSYFFFNYKINCIFLKKKKSLLIWCNNFIIQLPINFYFLKINKNSNFLCLKQNNIFYLEKIQLNMKKKINFFVKKIIFVGRGFKIEKKLKKIQFNFTKTFKIYYKIKRNKFFKIKKNKTILISKLNQSLELKKIFYLNIFSKKGLRLASQSIKTLA